MLSADEGGDCLGGHRHISVKFGVSARSGCFIKSAITTITYYAALLCAALRVLLVCLSVRPSVSAVRARNSKTKKKLYKNPNWHRHFPAHE